MFYWLLRTYIETYLIFLTNISDVHVHMYVRYISLILPIYVLLLKTSQFKTVSKDDSGYITQLKQQKSKKGDIT